MSNQIDGDWISIYEEPPAELDIGENKLQIETLRLDLDAKDDDSPMIVVTVVETAPPVLPPPPPPSPPQSRKRPTRHRHRKRCKPLLPPRLRAWARAFPKLG